MSELPPIRAAKAVPASAAGIAPARPWIDLRLDGNQGRAPSASFWRQLAGDGELLRCYPTDAGLERALAARHGVPAEHIFVGAGADDVLDRLCRAVLEPGRAAILPVPTFEMLERYVALTGAALVTVPWPRGPWPREQVLAAIAPAIAPETAPATAPATAMVAIVSPNNPTGLVASAADVSAVCRAAPGAIVLVDAAYAEFGGEDLTRAALAFDNAVVVRTFSKALGLAGLRVGYAIGPPRVIAWLRCVGSPFTCGTWSRAAAVHRLATGAAEVEAYVRTVVAERQALAAVLAASGFEPLPSAGNFVFARGGDPLWLRDALSGLGIAVRAFPAGVRITVPGDEAQFARLAAGVAAAMRPTAMLLDLDGVLADIDGRRALASPAELQALAALLPVGVVTSCPRRLAQSVLERHGLAPHVHTLVTAEDGPGKPDPAPVRVALQRLGQSAAWMLGDNPGDLLAARRAGVVPLAVEPRGLGAEGHAAQLREHGAVRLVGGLGGLVQLLATLR